MRVRLSIVLSFCLCSLPLAHADQITSLATFGDKATVSIVADGGAVAASAEPVYAAQQFVEQHAAALKIAAPAQELSLKSVETDSLDTSHVRFRQEVEGIPVWGAELAIHLDKNNAITSATGSVSELGALDTTPKLSADEAVAAARADWFAEFGADDGILNRSRLFVVDEILFDKQKGTSLHLAWEIRLASTTAQRSFKYLVDAHSGAVIKKFPEIKTLNRVVFDCSPGSFTGFNDGKCRNEFVPQAGYFFGRSEGQPDRGPNPIYTSDQLDTDFIYYRVGVAHQYFQSQFGRNGANFSGGIGVNSGTAAFTPAASYAGDGENDDQFGISFCPNANWDPQRERLSFCKGMPTMDIVGHEYTHALEFFSIRDEFGFPSGFNSANESGSLSEGFSDVFGEATERFAYGSNDWVMGSSQGVLTPIMRDLADPAKMGNPNTLYSPLYYCGSEDGGGIHINNVVLGQAAFRLANGGELSGCLIQGIGAQKQEAIFYRAVATYLTPSSGFAGAYTALVNACNDFFGSGSQECLQTRRTLNAVMMNQPGRCSGVPQAPVDCLDPSDLCPTNPNKRAPGICGCADEVDGDNNGSIDCLPAPEFKADVAALGKQIKKLTVTPTTKQKKAAQNAIKADINRLLAELANAVNAFSGQIQLNSTKVPLSKLFSTAKKDAKSALKTSSGDFSGNKSKASRSVAKLLKTLV